jgi:NAD-dependent dihydropyrimidine dehydrogenase PreA subunit
MKKKIKISIDYAKCGDGIGVDPRYCCKCLQVCSPAIFLLHQTIGSEEKDPYDPKKWRVTALWPSLCNLCMICVNECPVNAVSVVQ